MTETEVTKVEEDTIKVEEETDTKVVEEKVEEVQDDTSLDNFFAKKDKSKKPKKKKTKKSDESDQGSKSEKPKVQGDDWNDFEEEKEKDYSSLKIQTLQVVDDNREDNNDEENENEGEMDEDGVRKKAVDGKWNVPTAPAAQAEAAPAGPTLAGTHNVVGGKYVPPSVKRSNMMAMGQPTSSRKPLAAPDIQSKAAFPTLSAANQDLSAQNKATDFEAVKRGVKSQEARVDDNTRPRLALGNRYDSLCS